MLFGDGRAFDPLKKIALDKDADLSARKAALQSLIDNRAPDLRGLCEQLVDEQFLNSVAARGLAGFDDPAVGAKLVRAYRQFHPSERGQLISTLVSRGCRVRNIPTMAAATNSSNTPAVIQCRDFIKIPKLRRRAAACYVSL